MSKCETFSADEVRQIVRSSIATTGSLRKWSAAHRLHAQQVSRILLGQDGVTDKLAATVGLRKVVKWEGVPTRVDE